MKIKEFYESIQLEYKDEERVQNIAERNKSHKILESAQALHPKKVLDIGCGDGFFSQQIHAVTEASVNGMDISLRRLKQTAARGISVEQCNLDEGICFKAETFDLVYCSEVIEHVIDPDWLLDEIWRVLVPGGNLILLTPNLAAWYNRLLLLLGVQPYHTDTSTRKTYGRYLGILGQGAQPVGHLRVFTLAALKDILRECHFETCFVQALPFLPIPILYQIDKLIGLIPSLGSDLIVLARKSQ